MTYQQPNERWNFRDKLFLLYRKIQNISFLMFRCYHIFFQLIEEGVVEGLQDLVLMSTDPYDYFL